jgi:hypothetical protein
MLGTKLGVDVLLLQEGNGRQKECGVHLKCALDTNTTNVLLEDPSDHRLVVIVNSRRMHCTPYTAHFGAGAQVPLTTSTDILKMAQRELR